MLAAGASMNVEFRENKRLDPVFSRQSQTHQFPCVLQVNVKIKKRAALGFRHHPLRQLRQRHVTGAELKLVPFFRLRDFLPRLGLSGANSPRQRSEVAKANAQPAS